jgi:hypothetical protein
VRLVRLALVILCVTCISNSLSAQQGPPPPPRDAQALALLQRSAALLSGGTNVNDVTLTGTANWTAGSDDEDGSATLKTTAIGQGRVDLSLTGGQRSEVMDLSQTPPTGGWCGIDGIWHSMTFQNLFNDASWFFPEFLIGRAISNSDYAVSPADVEVQDGVSVEHITITQEYSLTSPLSAQIPGLGQIDLYLNASTLLPVSISFNLHPDDNALVNTTIEIEFSNYQTIQGVSVPYHIQKYVQGSLVLDTTVTGTQFNTGLSDSDFQPQ